ncbi:MAG TPA: hypothetical protein VNK26_00055, partial [Pyrinomonadaceae bacterium]|nr:hypothetical protein [Pyrinomonadaceae bacterium]
FLIIYIAAGSPFAVFELFGTNKSGLDSALRFLVAILAWPVLLFLSISKNFRLQETLPFEFAAELKIDDSDNIRIFCEKELDKGNRSDLVLMLAFLLGLIEDYLSSKPLGRAHQFLDIAEREDSAFGAWLLLQSNKKKISGQIGRYLTRAQQLLDDALVNAEIESETYDVIKSFISQASGSFNSTSPSSKNGIEMLNYTSSASFHS